MALAREANTPRHRWHQKRFHVKLTMDEASREWIYPAGVERINNHIADNGYLDVNGLTPVAGFVAAWENATWIDEFRQYEVNGLRPVLIADFQNDTFASVD